MDYRIELSKVALRDLALLGDAVSKETIAKLRWFQASPDPMKFAKALSGQFRGLYRFRIGDYRAIFKKDASGRLVVLLILRVKHRKEVYE